MKSGNCSNNLGTIYPFRCNELHRVFQQLPMGGNLCDFLLAFLNTKFLWKKTLPYRRKFATQAATISLSEKTPREASASVSICLKSTPKGITCTSRSPWKKTKEKKSPLAVSYEQWNEHILNTVQWHDKRM